MDKTPQFTQYTNKTPGAYFTAGTLPYMSFQQQQCSWKGMEISALFDYMI